MPWLQWLTRDDDIKKAKVAPYRLLEPAPELGAGDPHSPNNRLTENVKTQLS